MMIPDVTILIVTPDKHIVDWLRDRMEANGFAVLAASDGASALRMLASEDPSLVLMDDMPPASVPQLAEGGCGAQMDGCQFLRRLRLQSAVGVIVLSRERDEAIKLYFLDSGADDFLTWPFSRQELLARMRAVLRRTHPEGGRGECAEAAGVCSQGER